MIILVSALLATAALALGACHQTPPAEEPPAPDAQQESATRAAKASPSIQRHWDYLNRIRQNDEFNDAISRTLLNDRESQLGIVFFSSVAEDKIPDLMQKVMAEMAREFPREEVTVGAYAGTVPPHRVGVAQLDGATEKAVYTPSK